MKRIGKPKTFKNCLNCDKEIEVRILRDYERKKFCSHSCRQKWRFKQGEWNMNRLWEKNNTPEVNAKKVHIGEKHPLFIKDRSLVKKRPRYEMRIWRESVFERDNYTCQICGQRGGKLQADHIKPYALFPEIRWDTNNGRTLCVECHKNTDTHGYKTRELKRKLNKNAISQ